MSRQGTPKALLLLVCLLAVGLLAPASSIAAPGETTPPSIQGPDPPYAGDTLQGNDGTYTGGSLPGDAAVITGSEWLRCAGGTCSPTGNTADTYPLTSADIGKTIVYRQTVTCATPIECTLGGEQFDSDPTAVVLNPAPSIASSSISRAGRTLTANATVAGKPPVSVTYRWQRCTSTNAADCVNVAGASGAGQTFKLTTADISRRLRVRITATNAFGPAAVANPLLNQVIAAAPPTLTSSPTVSGSNIQGSTLNSTLGSFSGEGPITLRRQWVRCSDASVSSCTSIPGATAGSYTSTSGDLDYQLRVAISAEGLGVRVAYSAATTVIVGVASPSDPPAPTPSPELLSPFPRVGIAGRARRGSTVITKFLIRGPRGSRVGIRCRGRSCPFRTASAKTGRRALRFRRLQRAYGTGTVIEIFVTSTGKIGKYTRFRFRRRRAPSRADGCLNPGAKKPTRCP